MGRRSLLTQLVLAALVVGCKDFRLTQPEPPAPRPDPAIDVEPTARQIQERVAKVYATLTSYQDRGVVRTDYKDAEGGGHKNERPFTTAFTRDGRFRFEYQGPSYRKADGRYIIWSQGGQVRTWWGLLEREQTYPRIETAIAAATGVSGGSANTVPFLLLPGQADRSSLQDEGFYRIADGVHDGQNCFRIQRMNASPGRANDHGDDDPALSSRDTFWIDKASYLLVRVDDKATFSATRHLGPFTTFSQTFYYPISNQPVKAELLAFGR